MSQINKEKIEGLKFDADEIIRLSENFFSSIPIQREKQITSTGSPIPTFDGYINTEPNYIMSYSWSELSIELSELQIELLRKYDLWYENSRIFIRKLLSDRLDAFDEPYKNGRKYIILDFPPYKAESIKSFYGFKQHFNVQRNILSVAFSVVEDERTNKKILQEETIGLNQKQKAERIIKDWLENANGEVLAWLNYIDETTIRYLNELPRSSEVRIITSEIQNKNSFQKEGSKFGKSYPKLEVKMIRIDSEISDDKDFSEGEKAIIHKRKLISGNKMMDFGTDLKSSALGNTNHDMKLMEADKSDYEFFYKEWDRDESEWERIEGKPIKITYYKWPNE